MTLENYYSNLIAQNVERQQRLAKLEETLREEGLTEIQKQEKRQQHAIKETEFLRLKRSRLGVEDFEPLKGRIYYFDLPNKRRPLFYLNLFSNRSRGFW